MSAPTGPARASLRLSLSSLRAHKRRFAGTFLAVFLGVAFLAGTMVMGDTSGTPDQGGVGASNLIASGGAALRNVAATVRDLRVRAASRGGL